MLDATHQVVSPQWLAGFIDGEGCITLNTHKGTTRFMPALTVVNTHLPTLLTIQQTFGGRLTDRKPENERRKKVHSLVWCGTHMIRPVLEAVAPYVVTKRAQVDLLLNEWFPNYVSYRGGMRFKNVPEAQMEFRRDLKQRLTVLNKRGVDVSDDAQIKI